jgi:predicted permease
MNGLLQDLRIAVRDFLKNPGFALVAFFTLATGIGASTAMFSVVRGVLLAPLPYPHADQLMRVFYGNKQYPKFPFNPTDFLAYRERNRAFENIAVYNENDLELSDRERPERLTALRVTAEYFRVMGATVALGRDFDRHDEILGNDQILILSHDLWARRFSSNPNIVGMKITINRLPYVVIGVAPAGFQHPGGDYRSPAHGATVDAWTPFAFPKMGRGPHFLNGIGRLKPGVSREQATAEMNRIAKDLDNESGGVDPESAWHIYMKPLREEIVGGSERMLLVLLGSVVFVLLIACVNVAGLLLVRATARSRDMAVRAALGASRARLIRQSFTESMLLALIGAIGGQLLAIGAVRVLAKMAAATLPRAHMIRVDPEIVGFTLALSIVTAIVFGVVPAIAGSRGDLNRALHEAGRGTTSGSGAARLRGALVIGEIALASALLVGSGLFLRSFVNLLRVDPGFQPENVLTARIVLPSKRYGDEASRSKFFRDLMDRISNLPGVRAAGASTDVPWSGYDENGGFNIEGKMPLTDNDTPHGRYHSATPDYFKAMGIPLVAGRFFTKADQTGAPLVLIVNQALARKYFPGETVVGKRVSFGMHPAEKDFITIVGVAGDVKDAASSEKADPSFWLSEDQQVFDDMQLAVRAQSNPALLTAAIRNEVAQIDPELPLTNIRTMEQIAGASYSGSRLLLLLTGIFSALALGLAAIGTYGVIAYGVAQRTHEFGLRIALGARSWDVVKLVGGHGLRLALAGIAVGMLISAALARLLDKLLYGMTAYDPMTFAAAFTGALLVAMLAGYLPARRATKVDPMISLRAE